MGDILLRAVKIWDPYSPFHGQKCDIFIKGGKIEVIGKDLEAEGNTEVIEGEDLNVSVGWVDSHVPLTVLGDERRETLESLAACAVAGGFTDIICHPTHLSPLDTPEAIVALKAQTQSFHVDFHFVAAVTENIQGKNLTELGLLKQAGAIAFSNGTNPIVEPTMLIKIFQYLQLVNVPVVVYPHLGLWNDGQIDDSPTALALGFKGIPLLSETLLLTQTLELLKYYPAKLHFSPVTTKEGIEKIQQAQAAGFSVTADIASNYFAFSVEDCKGFEVMHKVFPPYRSLENQKALKEQVSWYQGLCSLHKPVIKEEKNLEFGLSEEGIIHLQTSVSLMAKYFDMEAWLPLVTYKPRQIFSLPYPSIQVGNPARLTIFQMNEWTFTQDKNKSLSQNSPFFETNFPLKVYKTIIS